MSHNLNTPSMLVDRMPSDGLHPGAPHARPPYVSRAVAGTLVLLILTVSDARGQTPLSAKALGMGGSYTAVARGHEALRQNPANLALNDGPRWSFSLAGLAIGGTASGSDLLDYADFLAGRGDEEAFLEGVHQGGTALELDVHASSLTIQSGAFAFGIAYHAIARQATTRDLIGLYVNGPDTDRQGYAVAGSSVAGADYLDVAAGYGFGFGSLRFGATAHYLHGRRLASRSAIEGRLRHEQEREPETGELLWEDRHVEVDYRDLIAEGGSGYALDLGLAWKPTQRWTLSGAVSGLVSRMAWGELRAYDLTGSPADLLELDQFAVEEHEGNGAPVVSGDAEAEALTALGRLPRTLRLGGALQPVRRVQLAASYQRRLAEGDLAGGRGDVLGVGGRTEHARPTLHRAWGLRFSLRGGAPPCPGCLGARHPCWAGADELRGGGRGARALDGHGERRLLRPPSVGAHR